MRELVRLRPRVTRGPDRALSGCNTVEDLRRLARQRLPKAVFDYVDGGADQELTLAANQNAFERWRFLPRILQDVAQVDLSVEVLGRYLPVPLGLAPTGFTRMIHPGGERAVAEAAASRGLPYGLSTVGTTSIEDLAASPHSDLWFQLYVLRDREMTRSLIERADKAGYQALEVAVDTAVSGRRLRDVRNGLTIPPQFSARTILDIGLHFRYWTSMLASSPLEFANLGKHDLGSNGVTAVEISKLYDASVSWEDLEEIRSLWHGPLLIKGPIGPDDARRAANCGIDGIHISNHGGRQLDRCFAAIDLVRPVRAAIGDAMAIVVDSGVRHGSDIAIAVALGADLCMVGRPYLYGLATAAQAGVKFVADLLTAELRRTLQLVGVTSIAELRNLGKELVASPYDFLSMSTPRSALWADAVHLPPV